MRRRLRGARVRAALVAALRGGRLRAVGAIVVALAVVAVALVAVFVFAARRRVSLCRRRVLRSCRVGSGAWIGSCCRSARGRLGGFAMLPLCAEEIECARIALIKGSPNVCSERVYFGVVDGLGGLFTRIRLKACA